MRWNSTRPKPRMRRILQYLPLLPTKDLCTGTVQIVTREKTKWISVDECEAINAETYEGRIQVEFRMDQKFLKRYLEASYVNLSDDQIRKCAADTHVNKIKDVSKLKCCDLEIRLHRISDMDFSLFRKDLSDPYVEMSIHSKTVKKKALFQACTCISVRALNSRISFCITLL